jgi:hypothetical protein
VRRIKQTCFPTFRSISENWVGAIHCTKHYSYSSSDNTHVNYASSFRVRCNGNTTEWRGLSSLLGSDASDEFGVPHELYRFRDHLICQLKKGGRWFILSYPKVHGCSTCDGQTESSFRVREFLCLHDLVWAGLDDEERDGLIYIEQFDTYEEFRHTISRTLLKKVIFS